MGMPYKEVGASHVALIGQLRELAQRLGGTANANVGEGRQDAPVGTTLALIEQATKVEGAVLKALHAARKNSACWSTCFGMTLKASGAATSARHSVRTLPHSEKLWSIATSFLRQTRMFRPAFNGWLLPKS